MNCESELDIDQKFLLFVQCDRLCSNIVGYEMAKVIDQIYAFCLNIKF